MPITKHVRRVYRLVKEKPVWPVPCLHAGMQCAWTRATLSRECAKRDLVFILENRISASCFDTAPAGFIINLHRIDFESRCTAKLTKIRL